MVLDNFISNNIDNWSISKNKVFYRKAGIRMPICSVEDDIIFVYLDNSGMHKPILKLVKYLINNNFIFYFYPPKYSIPSSEYNKNDIIFHYFLSYSNKYYYNGFKNINFDFIGNLVKWCIKEDCFLSIKESYDIMLEKINEFRLNYYSCEREYDYPEYIREDFASLYRNILLSQII